MLTNQSHFPQSLPREIRVGVFLVLCMCSQISISLECCRSQIASFKCLLQMTYLDKQGRYLAPFHLPRSDSIRGTIGCFIPDRTRVVSQVAYLIHPGCKALLHTAKRPLGAPVPLLECQQCRCQSTPQRLDLQATAVGTQRQLALNKFA